MAKLSTKQTAAKYESKPRCVIEAYKVDGSNSPVVSVMSFRAFCVTVFVLLLIDSLYIGVTYFQCVRTS